MKAARWALARSDRGRHGETGKSVGVQRGRLGQVQGQIKVNTLHAQAYRPRARSLVILRISVLIFKKSKVSSTPGCENKNRV